MQKSQFAVKTVGRIYTFRIGPIKFGYADFCLTSNQSYGKILSNVKPLPLSMKQLISVPALMGSLWVGTTCGALAKGCAPTGHEFTGYSHHYGDHLHGRRTSSGQPHDKFKLTAAHRTLPFGTHLQVKNTRNGKSCVVVVNDRGPFGSPSLVLDVSKAAANKLGFPGGGKIPVTCTVIDPKAGAIAIKDALKDSPTSPTVAAKPATTEATKSVAIKPDGESTTKMMVMKPANEDAMKAALSEAKQKLAKIEAQEAKIIGQNQQPQKKPIAAKPTDKTQVAAKPQIAMKPPVVAMPAAMTATHEAAKPQSTQKIQPKTIAHSEPVHEAPANATFLLVINEALPEQLKTAEFHPTTHAHKSYTPTVFMKVDEHGGQNAEKNRSVPPRLADNKVLM
jgi:rare lipoprotein A